MASAADFSERRQHMATIGQSLAERFSRWQVLANNLKDSARATPAVAEELAEMDSLLTEARGLQDRQAQIRGQSREITKQLVDIARRGDKVRRRLGAILQGKLGFTNEELIRYGIRPRRLPIRRRKKDEPAVEKVSSAPALQAATASPATPAGSTTTPSTETPSS
jgi:hypothetical protein